MAWDKYKFNKEVGSVIDAMRARGVVNEEDAQTMSTIYKQGWLGTTATRCQTPRIGRIDVPR